MDLTADENAPDPGRDVLIGEVVATSLSRSVAAIIERDAGVRLGLDPEDLHQFRVATRRLRSDLRTFGPWLDSEWAAALREELKWLGSQVGPVRDADVLGARLNGRIEDLSDEDRPAARRICGHLAAETGELRRRMLVALSSARYRALLSSLVAAADAPVFVDQPPGLADLPGRPLLADVVRGQWRRLRRAAEAIGTDASDERLHEVRILAKRCRYSAEAAAPAYGHEASRFADAIAEVQTVLGDHQDTVVAEAWLRKTAKLMPSVRLAAGVLVAHERSERAHHRKQFGGVWRKASRRRLRNWLD